MRTFKDAYLSHYGVLGMRWGHRRAPVMFTKSRQEKADKVFKQRNELMKDPAYIARRRKHGKEIATKVIQSIGIMKVSSNIAGRAAVQGHPYAAVALSLVGTSLAIRNLGRMKFED